MLCAKFGWNWSSGSGEEDENVKSLRRQQQRQQRWWTTDKFWSENIMIKKWLKKHKFPTFFMAI